MQNFTCELFKTVFVGFFNGRPFEQERAMTVIDLEEADGHN